MPPRSPVRPWPALVFSALGLGLAVAFLLAGGFAAAPSPSPLYVADAATLLFDDFEGSTLGETRSANVAFNAPGYLGGTALNLPETGAFVEYPDTWLGPSLDPDPLDSGTIEMYYRAESTFLYAPGKFYGCLFTMNERTIIPNTDGHLTLAVSEQGLLSWSFARAGDYIEALHSAHPPLYPGQWYHLAATWGHGEIRLFVNNTLVRTMAVAPSIVPTDPFKLGARGDIPEARGLAARGRIDRFRVSARARTAGEFPAALAARIAAPAGGETLARPFALAWSATATETRPRLVDLYADSDGSGFNGISLHRGLAESGTILTGASLGDSTWWLYAVARAGGDSAFFYLENPIAVVTPPGSAGGVAPAETTAAVAPPVASTESFLTVILSGGGVAPAPLASSANLTGGGANYAVASRLLSPDDTVVAHVWTREASAGLALGLRADTASLSGAGLPPGIPNTAAGRAAFGATVVATEFIGANGLMIGDTRTTSYIGDSFAYTLEYRLSAATAERFRAIGFDLSAFGYYFADTYGGRWIEDTTVRIQITPNVGGGLTVTVAGLTRDLPGGLGGAADRTVIVRAERPGWCLLTEAGLPDRALAFLRGLRDAWFGSRLWRLLVSLYYAFAMGAG